MRSKPEHFSRAIDELEGAHSDDSDIRARVLKEFHNLEETLEKIKPHISDLKDKAERHARHTKKRVETQVQENPWAALGIVGLAFLVIGLLLGSKRSRR